MARPGPEPVTAPAEGARPRRCRVGLLGGSFNPAHDGHRYISLLALTTLALDEVWWLVSPQNPLKPVQGMAPLAARLARARAVARSRRIRIGDFETPLGTRFTADTLTGLRRRHPRHAFVWLMGADNLAQMPRWKQWPVIFRTIPVAVFARGPYCLKALSGMAARRWVRWRVGRGRQRQLAGLPPPAWAFLPIRLHPASATRIRAAGPVSADGWWTEPDPGSG